MCLCSGPVFKQQQNQLFSLNLWLQKNALNMHHICTKMISNLVTCSAHHVHKGVTLNLVSTVWRSGSQRNIFKPLSPTTPACWLCPQSLTSPLGLSEHEFIMRVIQTNMGVDEMGQDSGKPVFGVSYIARFKPACSATETS